MERMSEIKKLLEDKNIGKNKVIHTNCCICKNYERIENGDIIGKNPNTNIGNPMYDRIKLLNSISNYGKQLFNLYKKSITWNNKNDFDIEFGNFIGYWPIENFSNKRDRVDSILFKSFSEYGMIGDVIDSEDFKGIPVNVITEKEVRKIVNQLITIYIVNVIHTCISELENGLNDEISNNVLNLNSILNIISKNYEKKEFLDFNTKELSKYIDYIKEILLNVINEHNFLFSKSIYKYITYDIDNYELHYNTYSDNLLCLVWDTLISLVSVENTNQNIICCIDCGKYEERTGKNQKRCKKCQEEKDYSSQTDENKKAIIRKIKRYDISKIKDKSLKKEVEKVVNLNSRGIHDTGKSELNEILEKLKSQK